MGFQMLEQRLTTFERKVWSVLDRSRTPFPGDTVPAEPPIPTICRGRNTPIVPTTVTGAVGATTIASLPTGLVAVAQPGAPRVLPPTMVASPEQLQRATLGALS